MRRAVLGLALLLAATTAHAGAVLTSTSSHRIDVGPVGGFGSQINDSDGWSLSCWVSTTLATQSTIMFAQTTGAQGVSPNSQEFQWGLQETWGGTDFASLADSLLWDFGDRNNNGPLYRTTAGITIRNTGIHHHLLTVSGATGSPSGSSTNGSIPAVWYVDNVARSTWTKEFILGTAAMLDWVNTVAIGAERKNGGTWFNFNDGTYVECRAYTRALSANEVNEIYMGRGWDAVTSGLLRRWPLQHSGCSEYIAGSPCVPQNGPTWTTSYEMNGIRRRN
jgi:hypothetical protein